MKKKTQGVDSIICMLSMELSIILSIRSLSIKSSQFKVTERKGNTKGVREHEWEEPKFLSLQHPCKVAQCCSLIEK